MPRQSDWLIRQNAEFFHGDWWPYGTQANRHAIDTYLRYHHEQRLSDQRLTADEELVPDLLDT